MYYKENRLHKRNLRKKPDQENPVEKGEERMQIEKGKFWVEEREDISFVMRCLDGSSPSSGAVSLWPNI